MKNNARTEEKLWRAWCLPLAVLSLSWLAIAWASLAPPEGTAIVGVVFPPWWDGARAIAAAGRSGVEIIRSGALPAILIVRLAEPGAAMRLREAGALFELNPEAIGGCGNEAGAR